METTTANKITSYLLFRLGEETFTFNVRYVLNILEMKPITAVPKSPAYLKGVINLRGAILPVVDLRQKLNLSPIEVTPNTCILVLDFSEGEEKIQIGAMVDAVTGVHEFEEDEIKMPPKTQMQGTDVIKGIIQKDDDLIMLPDISELFTAEELNTLDNINDKK